MVRVFDKNMFVMTFSVMIGFIIVTYFIADIVHQSQIQALNTEHKFEIESIEENNINFTSSFLESSLLLDSAREERAFGNYHFDIAHLFYTSALSERNESLCNRYKEQCVSNSTKAMPNYLTSHYNFLEASKFFEVTKEYTVYENYIHLLTLYVNLTLSGARLTFLRYNASNYMKMLAENITYVNGSGILENVTELLMLFNETMVMYGAEMGSYEEYMEEIDEYDIKGFSTIREPT
jgi:hypothetical protein